LDRLQPQPRHKGSTGRLRSLLSMASSNRSAQPVCRSLLGELLALRWQDVDFLKNKIRVSHSLWNGELVSPKTEDSAASVPMKSALREALLRQRAQTSGQAMEQSLLRHASYSTTADIYVHVSDEVQEEAAAALEQAIFPESVTSCYTNAERVTKDDGAAVN
jgi:integrase